MAAMVNPVMSPLVNPNMKDSRWLTLEVCREFTRNKCSRTDEECKFAHPPAHVEVQNGRVVCCYDSLKGKCQRKDPPCKYLHPPQHLREQLLQNGKNNLIIRNLQMQAMAGISPPANIMSPASAAGMYPATVPSPYLIQNGPYSYLNHSLVPVPTAALEPTGSAGAMVPGLQQPPKVARQDRLEPTSSLAATSSAASVASNGSSSNGGGSGGSSGANGSGGSGSNGSGSGCAGNEAAWTTEGSQFSPPVYFQPQVVEVLTPANKKRPRDPADDLVLANQPPMVPIVKRTAVDSKSGVPMYQPQVSSSAAAALYQPGTLAAMQPFMPATLTAAGQVSCVPENASSVNYFDENQQLLDTLPVCRDFKMGQCHRTQCKYVHLVEDYVEVCDGKVTVCRDAAKGKCSRGTCRYYHIPNTQL